MSNAPAHAPVSLVKDAPAPAPANGETDRQVVPPTPAADAPVEGYLAIAVRVPVRIVTLLLILPVRMIWDALTVCGRALKRTVWVPFARAVSRVWHAVLAPVLYALFIWPWLALWRHLLAPVGRAVAWLAGAVGHGLAAGARGIGAALAWLGRTLILTPLSWIYGRLLTPLGHGMLAVLRGVRAGLAWLGRYVLVVPGRAIGTAVLWAVRLLVAEPAAFLYRWVLTPLGRGIVAGVRGLRAGLAWLWRYGAVVPCGFFYRWVLTPLGHGVVAGVRGLGAGLAWLWRYGVALPCGFVHRWVLAPAGRAVAVIAKEIAEAFGHAWRVAGYVSRAVFRFLGALLRFLIADPAVWVWQHAVRPLGRGLRDGIWRPAARVVREVRRTARAALVTARASVRETRAELRRALFGAPSEPERKPLPDSGRVPWVAGSPHNSATTPNTFGPKRDDADFRTL